MDGLLQGNGQDKKVTDGMKNYFTASDQLSLFV